MFEENGPNDPATDKNCAREKQDDGWSDYQVISILGEGSYGKVYKVVKKDVQTVAKSGAKSSTNSGAKQGIRRLPKP